MRKFVFSEAGIKLVNGTHIVSTEIYFVLDIECVISKINLHSGHALPAESCIVHLSNDGPNKTAEESIIRCDGGRLSRMKFFFMYLR